MVDGWRCFEDLQWLLCDGGGIARSSFEAGVISFSNVECGVLISMLRHWSADFEEHP